MKNYSLGNIIAVAFLAIFALLSLFPMLWMLLISLKPGTSVISVPPDLSLRNLTIINFKNLLDNSIVMRWTLNSLIVVVTVTVCNVIFSSMAGYAFAKKEFAGKKILFAMLIGIMMVSAQVIMIPLFITVKSLGLLNRYLGLILPVMVSPMYVFLAVQFIKGVHNELIYAARIDGCGEWKIYRNVILPLSTPVLAIIAIFCFITYWNDFLWPLVVTSTKDMRTLPVGLASLQQIGRTDYGFLMAGSVFATIPIVAIFLMCSKYFIKGLSAGAVKG